MAFKIMARTLLELGAELISSDGVALYELIKNSVDAGSRRVRIDVVSQVTRSQLEKLLEITDLVGSDVSTCRRNLIEALDENLVQKLDPIAAGELRPHVTAARTTRQLEDAIWSWYDQKSYIDVIDKGRGMSLGDLDSIYLTIGTRSRRKEREQIIAGSRTGDAPLGEKGVGRLSTMRLGELLEVRTSREGDTHDHILNIDWGLC